GIESNVVDNLLKRFKTCILNDYGYSHLVDFYHRAKHKDGVEITDPR
ncbi:MAG: hypothetical protein HRT37_20840, partial [Alteromonadaceae bacterium]|nr:hypothetical protein [Alteromonadaceae bacterium]